MALLFQVIYLSLHVVEFTIGSVGNVGDVASRSSLEGGGVIEVIGNQALTRCRACGVRRRVSGAEGFHRVD